MSSRDVAAEIETLRASIRGDADADGRERDLDDRDREALIQMSDNIYLVPSECGDLRHLKLLRHCALMAEHAGPLVDVIDDKAAAKRVVRWIHRRYDNEHTNQDYRSALRSFGRYHEGLDEPPEALEWIPTGTSNNFDPTPSARDLLDYETDIKPMVDVCQNDRDRALIMVQFEAGLRSGELYDLRVGDVFDSDHSTGLHVDGKRGERAVHLIVSVPYLQQWLTRHPTGDDDDWLWSKLAGDADRANKNTFLDYFKLAAERADVSKAVTPTNFRKSNTRWLIQLGMPQTRIEDRQGRKHGSEHTARYVASFGDESNERAYARLHGADIETEETQDISPLECPRCGKETPRDRDHCVWCHMAMTHEAAAEEDERKRDAMEGIAEDPERAEAIMNVEDALGLERGTLEALQD